MEKAFKYRIYPNREQRILLAKTFGCTRFVYNHYLANDNVKIKFTKMDRLFFTNLDRII